MEPEIEHINRKYSSNLTPVRLQQPPSPTPQPHAPSQYSSGVRHSE